ncbi:MAG: Arm DNA-binding domain-containing protein [Methylococcales bacterium]|nr:Arm DNA-binding domain-containing protein [Methylococcales bacterium]
MAEKLNKDTVYRASKPKDKDYFINDGGGLALMVKTTGSKLWYFVFTFEGKRERLSFGIYPDTTLEAARRKSEESRAQIANGVNPADIRNKAKKSKQLVKLNQQRANESLQILPGNGWIQSHT